MVSLSKLLDLGLRDAKCADIYHPGQTCTQFMYKHSHLFLITPMKYFLPILVTSLLVKGKDINKQHFLDSLRSYVEMVLAVLVTGQSVSFALCGTRAVYGQFSKYSIAFIPALLGSCMVYLVPAKIQRHAASSVFQVLLDSFLRNARNPVCQIIVNSKPVQTLILMLISAFVLHTNKKYNIRVLWMIQSIPQAKTVATKKCGHDEPCSKFCLKEVKNLALIGIALDLLKALTATNPKINVWGKLLKVNFSTTLFLTSYSVIYRGASCLLANSWNADPQFSHIIAAFLGGISFKFSPKLAMICYGAAICIEISWILFKNHKFSKSYKYLEKVKNLPISALFTHVCGAYLVHLYVFNERAVNKMGAALINAMHGNQTLKLKTNFDRWTENCLKQDSLRRRR